MPKPPMPRINKHLLESHVWNYPKNRGKNRKSQTPLVNIFTNKKYYYTAFESLRQALVRYFFLVDKISILKNHQDWVFDIFSVLIDADTIINNYEAGIREYCVYGTTVDDLLKKEADFLMSISSIPMTHTHLENMNAQKFLDKSDSIDIKNILDELNSKLEEEYIKIEKPISDVYQRLIGA